MHASQDNHPGPPQPATIPPTPATKWYNILPQLHELQPSAAAGTPDREDTVFPKEVADVLTKALSAARSDSDWAQSGLPEALQRSLKLAAANDLTGARAAALQLLDFHHIVSRNAGIIPRETGSNNTESVQAASAVTRASGGASPPAYVAAEAETKRSLEPSTRPRSVGDGSTAPVVLSAADIPTDPAAPRIVLRNQGDPTSGTRIVLRDALPDYSTHMEGRIRLSTPPPLTLNLSLPLLPLATQGRQQLEAVGTDAGETPSDLQQPTASVRPAPATPPAKQKPPPALFFCGRMPRSSSAPCLQPPGTQVDATSPTARSSQAFPLASPSKASSHSMETDTSKGPSQSEASELTVPLKKRKRHWMPALPTAPELTDTATLDTRQPKPDSAARDTKSRRTQSVTGPAADSSGELTVLKTRPAASQPSANAMPAGPDSLLHAMSAVEWLALMQQLYASGALRELASPAHTAGVLAGKAAAATPSPFRSSAEQVLRRFTDHPPSRRPNAELEMLPSIGSTGHTPEAPPPETSADLQRLQLELHQSSNQGPATAAALEAARTSGQLADAAAAVVAAEVQGAAQTIAEALARSEAAPPSPLKHGSRLPQVSSSDLEPPSAAAAAASASAGGDTEATTRQVAQGRWNGRLKHRLGQSTVELCQLGMVVPLDALEQLPPTLFVAQLAPRADIKLANYVLLPCQLVAPTDKQRQKLHMLASCKLVAVCELQHCRIVLVPQLDARTSLRLVGFLLKTSI